MSACGEGYTGTLCASCQPLYYLEEVPLAAAAADDAQTLCLSCTSGGSSDVIVAVAIGAPLPLSSSAHLRAAAGVFFWTAACVALLRDGALITVDAVVAIQQVRSCRLPQRADWSRAQMLCVAGCASAFLPPEIVGLLFYVKAFAFDWCGRTD
jgi:hypothetical protein